MSDVYVYNFQLFSVGGEWRSPSLFSATLSAIGKIGTPIMESQAVVDASQITAEGYVVPSIGLGSLEITELSTEIESLGIRAAARDLLAHSMDARGDEAAIYMLSLESRHLRQQAHRLILQRNEILAAEPGQVSKCMALPHLSV
jgi:hypothetical protein